jgi:HEAT repeat protein
MKRAAAVFLVVGSLLAGCAGRSKQSIALYESGDYAGAARVADEGLASHPGDEGLWQMRVRAALALGDAEGVARTYASYRGQRDSDDPELLKDLAIATLGQALASPSVRLKIAAIEAVASAEIQALADQVAERLGDDDDRVAAAAATAVLRGYPQAPQVASEMLRSHDAEARRIAVEGIGKKVGKLAVLDLQKLAGSDPDPRVRRAAIRWLGQVKAQEAGDVLERQLRHTDEGVRAAAALALARIGKGDLAAYAKKALGDRALAVRLAGIELLLAAKNTAELVKLASDDPDAIFAAEAAFAARRPDLATRALDRAVGDEGWSIRAGAANMASRASGKTHAIVLAKKLLADPEPRVRLAAARVLAHAGDRRAAIEIFAASLTGDSALGAATDLAELGDKRGLDLLDAMVRDAKSSPDQRAAAASAHRSARKVTPGLVAALADANGVVRVEAATVLVMLAKPER